MGDLTGVKAGDELLLLIKYGGPREKEREPKAVTVYKVGRTLVHILRYEGKPEHGTETYKIENGERNDNYGHAVLSTRAAYEEDKKRQALLLAREMPVATLEALLKVLEEAGI
jgi:hypothetical protein